MGDLVSVFFCFDRQKNKVQRIVNKNICSFYQKNSRSSKSHYLTHLISLLLNRPLTDRIVAVLYFDDTIFTRYILYFYYVGIINRTQIFLTFESDCCTTINKLTFLLVKTRFCPDVRSHLNKHKNAFCV